MIKLHTKQQTGDVRDKMSQHLKYSEAQAELQRENGLVYLFMFKQCRQNLHTFILNCIPTKIKIHLKSHNVKGINITGMLKHNKIF